MSVESRLAKLEKVLGSARCPACGMGDAVPGEYVEFTLHTDGKPLDPAPPCEACGRTPITFTLKIDRPGGDGRGLVG